MASPMGFERVKAGPIRRKSLEELSKGDWLVSNGHKATLDIFWLRDKPQRA